MDVFGTGRMKHRFTLKEIEEWDDERIIDMLIKERISGCRYRSPLQERLTKIQERREAEE